MSEESKSQERRSRTSVRVDQPHLLSRDQLVPPDPPTSVELSALAGRDPAQLVDQLQRQALELGERLQSQQCELDRREAEFHARIATVENELRASRLVCAEREIELSEQLQDQQSRNDSTLDPSLVEQVHRLDDLHRLDGPESALVPMPPSMRAKQRGTKVVNPTNNGKDWQARLAEVEKSERLLQSQLAQIAFDRRKLDDDRKALIESRRAHDQKSSELIDESKEKFENELIRLQNWSQKLDRRNTAIEQLHLEASRMYREALEMRVCTEQLWFEVTESVSETEATHRISELRCQLMDQFHLASQRALEQKQELESLMERLDSHHGNLRQQRDELRQWVARRHAEIESDAEKLLARERELEIQAGEINRVRSDWTEQRHEYEQKIRRLSRMVNSANA